MLPPSERAVKLDLEGVHVRVFYVPSRGRMDVLRKKEKTWRERMERGGAESVCVFDVGQTRGVERLMDSTASKR